MSVTKLLKAVNVLEDRALHHEKLAKFAASRKLPELTKGYCRAAVAHREMLWNTVDRMAARLASQH